jgi:hypothetical protein
LLLSARCCQGRKSAPAKYGGEELGGTKRDTSTFEGTCGHEKFTVLKIELAIWL